MSDLSKRFEELMARMARTDAKLFRTIGEQNAALHGIAQDMGPDAVPAASMDQEDKPSMMATLAAASLLPREECDLKQLKKRFRTVALAQAFLEERLGAPPKGIRRLTWALVEQTVTTGHWPAGKSSGSRDGRSGSSGAMAAMEQRLQRRLECMEQRLERLERLELLLLQVLEQQQLTAAAPSPG